MKVRPDPPRQSLHLFVVLVYYLFIYLVGLVGGHSIHVESRVKLSRVFLFVEGGSLLFLPLCYVLQAQLA